MNDIEKAVKEAKELRLQASAMQLAADALEDRAEDLEDLSDPHVQTTVYTEAEVDNGNWVVMVTVTDRRAALAEVLAGRTYIPQKITLPVKGRGLAEELVASLHCAIRKADIHGSWKTPMEW